MASALSAACSRMSVCDSRPSGRPRRIVEPATAPRTRICVETRQALLRSVVRRTLQAAATIVDVRTHASAKRMAQRHSVDEYLETIYFLAFPIGEYRPQDDGHAHALVARRRDARRLARLGRRDAEAARGRRARRARRAQGGDPHRRRGRERAERVVRKHRIIERLLTDFMGYTAAEAHVHADELGDTFTDDMVERIDEKLGHPERCPHGWPVDTEFEQAENRELAPLSALEPGDRRDDRAARRARRRAPALVLRRGLVPGAKHRGRRAAEPAAGQFRVRAERRREGDRREGRRRALRRPRGVALRALGSGAFAGAARPGGLAERVGLVDALPREVVVVAAEVAVRGGLRVDRPAQVEVAQDRGRAQVEVLADELLDPRRPATCSVPKQSTRTENGCATPIA